MIVMTVHRITTVEHSDHTYVLDEGRVVDQETDTEFAAHCTAIRTLAKLHPAEARHR